VPLHAIITAGGRLPKQLRAPNRSAVKALLKVDGKSMLEVSTDAAQACSAISNIAIVGNNEVRAATPADCTFVAEGETVVDNIWRAFDQLGGLSHDYLVLSPDLPFLNASSLNTFIENARADCELGMPLVRGKDFLAQFPNAPNRFARVDGQLITMGSCLFLTGPILKSNIPLMRDVYRSRKSLLRLAVLLGWSVLIGLVMGHLRLKALEARAKQLTGAEARGIWLTDASIAYDIDNRQNYEYALKLGRRQA